MATQTNSLDNISRALFRPERRQYLSFREASEVTSLSERTLRRLHKAGNLEARKVGSRWLIPQQALTDLLNRLS